jgi:hypothetical protein
VTNTRQAYQAATRMLAANCYAMYRALLCGRPSPNQAKQMDWVRSPRLGDMVFVDAARQTSDAAKTVGRWTRMWTYFYPLDELDGDLSYADRMRDVVYEIELLDGSFYSWSNVQLLRVPADFDEWLDITHGKSYRPERV